MSTLLVPFVIDAMDFKKQLAPGISMIYNHWDMQKKKTTGKTTITYHLDALDPQRIVETTQNTTSKGELYLEKTVVFSRDTGTLLRYDENDLKTGLSISERYVGGKIQSTITQDGEHRKFSISLNQQLVPFGVFFLQLRKKIPDIIKKKGYRFELYLPAMAFELGKNHLPLSLSQIGMKTIIQKTIASQKSPLGEVPAVELLIRPTSLFLGAMLPEEKTNFRFTFSTQPPYHLLSFQDGPLQIRLEKISRNPENSTNP